MPTGTKSSCLEDLRRRILSTEILPSTDLDETQLSERYGVSRTPLREVLQKLAGEGYVTLTDNRGARVSPMDLATMRTFFQTAPLIYASVVRLAAETRTDAQIYALKREQSEFAAAVSAGSTAEMALANHRFHRLIGEMAHNAYLMPSLNRLLIDHTRLGQVFYRPATPEEKLAITEASRQHDAIIAAIEAGAAADAVALTLRHWDLSRDRIERFVRPEPLPLQVSEERRNAV